MAVVPQQGERRRPPDESMSLLNEIFDTSLDEGYIDAARRRDETGKQRATAGAVARSPALMVGLLGVGLLFTVAALQVQRDAGTISVEREQLLEQVQIASDRTSELERQIANLQNQIVESRASQLDNFAEGDALRRAISSAQSAVGTAPVTGPGIVVEIHDTIPGAVGFDDCDVQSVVDYDLRIVLNGLWAAGAEAISLNGERITPLTAIRGVNDVIQVNSRPVGAPYVISAIGDSQTLAGDFASGSGGELLRWIHSTCGIEFDIEIHQSLRLPGGTASLQVARPETTS